MATAKQIAANKLNAKNSPGPSSPEAKAKVSQNHTVHGLCGKFRVQPFESQERFDTLFNSLMEAEKPADASETELVVKMAEHTWLARRALRCQDNCFTMEPKTADQELAGVVPVGIDPRLERYVRYHGAQDRAYRRASQELLERRKQRQLAEIGIERKKQAEAEEQRKQAQERRRQEDAQRRPNEDRRREERHKVANAMANLRKQREEIKVAKELAAVLPDDPAAFASMFAGSRPNQAPSPVTKGGVAA
jgi:hypothetical protein